MCLIYKKQQKKIVLCPYCLIAQIKQFNEQIIETMLT